MLHTTLCDLLGIEIPIIQASLGPWSTPKLTAAVSNSGAIGSLGTVLLTPGAIRAQVRRIRELTDRPFVVNFSQRSFSEDGFAAALIASVPVISFAHGDPRQLPRRAHEAGALFIQVVKTVREAREAADRGVDAIIAQGTESSGGGGTVTSLCLLPQVAQAVAPLPVIGAGGVADGRGLAVALMLGAQGVSVGTRFVASTEAGISEAWRRRIVEAESEDAVRMSCVGQSVGAIREVLPVADIVRRTVGDAVATLCGARSFVRPVGPPRTARGFIESKPETNARTATRVVARR
jgi:enoyl-[acyl-carrier protein] reductase II